VSGPLASQVDVQNDNATKGGSEKTIAYVTAEDRQKLQESLTRMLADRLNQQVKAQLPAASKETVVPWSGQNPAVLESKFSKNVDEEAQTLSLTLKLRYGATAFSNDSYNSLVRGLAGATTLQLKPGFALSGASINPLAPEVLGVENGSIRLMAHAKGTVAPELNASRLGSALANRPIAEAQAYLGSLPGVTQVDVHAWPGWLGRMPLLGLRIGVRTASVGPLEAH